MSPRVWPGVVASLRGVRGGGCPERIGRRGEGFLGCDVFLEVHP